MKNLPFYAVLLLVTTIFSISCNSYDEERGYNFETGEITPKNNDDCNCRLANYVFYKKSNDTVVTYEDFEILPCHDEVIFVSQMLISITGDTVNLTTLECDEII